MGWDATMRRVRVLPTRVLGDWAFDLGTFSFTISPKPGGDTTEGHGKYLFAYSRGADRAWKLARAIVSRDDRDVKVS